MIADLYIRVSTDEQADKGYSQRYQEEVLKRYCDINRIQIRNIIFEDHSAKTFHRPAWNKLLLSLKKHKHVVDLILFTKWDRFSRNTGDSYHMIDILRKLGVEPQAIEQPLDLSVPENKMLLAFYLAIPEVENDRRALNVISGMRRARKEGRWMGSAPFGYANKTREDGSKYICPVEPAASVMKWAFEQLARGIFNTEQIWKMAQKKGFRMQKVNFWQLIRNPMYCGKIRVPKFKEEEELLVKGLHEPLISEGLFYDVQDVLDGRRRRYRTRMDVDKEIPLRGFLICPKCKRALSGSASTGRHQRYYYYHCNATCGCRYNAEKVNQDFENEIQRYTPHHGIVDLYKHIININYFNKNKEKRSDLQQLNTRLADANNDLAKARKLLLAEDIDPADYRSIKAECDDKIARLEAKISDLSKEFNSVEVKALLEKASTAVSNLHQLYHDGDVFYKRQVVSALFPQNLEYEGGHFRTAHLNEVVATIFSLDVTFTKQNSVQKEPNSLLYAKEVSSGFEPL